MESAFFARYESSIDPEEIREFSSWPKLAHKMGRDGTKVGPSWLCGQLEYYLPVKTGSVKHSSPGGSKARGPEMAQGWAIDAYFGS